MTTIELEKAKVKVGLAAIVAFIGCTATLTFKGGVWFEKFEKRMEKYDNYEQLIEQHEANDNALHKTMWAALARKKDKSN